MWSPVCTTINFFGKGAEQMARDDQIYARYYDSARAELIQRIALRDQALMAYVLVIGGYLGFFLHRYPDLVFAPPKACEASALTFPVPIICLLFSLVIIQHHLVINELGVYLFAEWPKNLENGV